MSRGRKMIFTLGDDINGHKVLIRTIYIVGLSSNFIFIEARDKT